MLIRGGVYVTFLLPNAAFIGERPLKEKIRYIFKENIWRCLEKKQETLLEIFVHCCRLCMVYRLLFSKIQISFNHRKTLSVRKFTIHLVLGVPAA